MSMTQTQAKLLGCMIAEGRERKRLTLRQLAEMVEVPPSSLGALEQGRYLDFDATRVARIADALDIDLEYINEITGGAVADRLPEMRTYFRAKYALTPKQLDRVERCRPSHRRPDGLHADVDRRERESCHRQRHADGLLHTARTPRLGGGTRRHG